MTDHLTFIRAQFRALPLQERIVLLLTYLSMTIPVFMLMLRALSSRTLAHAWTSPLWLDS